MVRQEISRFNSMYKYNDMLMMVVIWATFCPYVTWLIGWLWRRTCWITSVQCDLDQISNIIQRIYRCVYIKPCVYPVCSFTQRKRGCFGHCYCLGKTNLLCLRLYKQCIHRRWFKAVIEVGHVVVPPPLSYFISPSQQLASVGIWRRVLFTTLYVIIS